VSAGAVSAGAALAGAALAGETVVLIGAAAPSFALGSSFIQSHFHSWPGLLPGAPGPGHWATCRSTAERRNQNTRKTG